MFIQTQHYNVELKASLRNISKLQDAVAAREGDCNLRRYISKAIENVDVRALAVLTTNLGNLSYDDFDKFFDEYTEEKSVISLFEIIARTINDAGFFDRKLDNENLLEEMTSVDSKIDMSKMVQDAIQTQVNVMLMSQKKSKK